MNEAERDFRPQEQFGRIIKENDFVIFQILLHNPETVVCKDSSYVSIAYVSIQTENKNVLC